MGPGSLDSVINWLYVLKFWLNVTIHSSDAHYIFNYCGISLLAVQKALSCALEQIFISEICESISSQSLFQDLAPRPGTTLRCIITSVFFFFFRLGGFFVTDLCRVRRSGKFRENNRLLSDWITHVENEGQSEARWLSSGIMNHVAVMRPSARDQLWEDHEKMD